MASDGARAVELKNKGNQAFKEHDWDAAIEFYTKAIELNDKEPTFYTNRAQVRMTSPRNTWEVQTDENMFTGANKGGSIWSCDCGRY